MKITEALCKWIESAGGSPTSKDESSITHAMSTLYTALGGSEPTNETDVASMVKSISTVAGGGIEPTGTIDITQNGEVDVTEYALANVNVPTVTPPTMSSITVKNSTGLAFDTYYMDSSGAWQSGMMIKNQEITFYIPQLTGYYKTRGAFLYLMASASSASVNNIISSDTNVKVGKVGDNQTVMLGVYSSSTSISTTLTVSA